jgi:hypothetical protein
MLRQGMLRCVTATVVALGVRPLQVSRCGAQVAGRAIADCVSPAGQRGLNIAGAVIGKADLARRHRQQIGDLPVYDGSGLLAVRRQQKNRCSKDRTRLGNADARQRRSWLQLAATSS